MSEGHVKDKHSISANDQGVCEICEGRENERFPTRLCDEASLQTVKNDLRFYTLIGYEPTTNRRSKLSGQPLSGQPTPATNLPDMGAVDGHASPGTQRKQVTSECLATRQSWVS